MRQGLREEMMEKVSFRQNVACEWTDLAWRIALDMLKPWVFRSSGFISICVSALS